MRTQANVNPSYTIKQVAKLTGISEYTLRYYEKIDLIGPIKRDESSKHRVYNEDDLNTLDGVACLSATGMPIRSMREYMANSRNGGETARQQIHLLQTQEQYLVDEAEYLRTRRQYVKLKIKYWEAAEKGDTALVQQIGDKARLLSRDIKGPSKEKNETISKSN